MTGMHERDRELPQFDGARAEREVVIVGGSMAGLLTARVLADHFDRVTVVERDRFPDRPDYRKGVPQSRHTHPLLRRGLATLEKLFPGFEAEIVGLGGLLVEWPRDALWLTAVGWSQRFGTGLTMLCASRELIEWTVRRRVAALPNVRFREEADAVGLAVSADRSQVVGVRVRSRSSVGERGEDSVTLPADLVVDASGRHSRTPDWLEGLGYRRPDETTINPFLGYASRYYRRPSDRRDDWQALLFATKPPTHLRGGVLLPIDGDRWMVTLVGLGRDYPPTEEGAFLEFARSLRSPVLYQAIADAEPLSSVRGFQQTENRLRHYERFDRWPERFVVLGDAVCAFNPVYGQGMTVAALSALVLEECLREHQTRDPAGSLVGFARDFQRRLARNNEAAWLLATGEDLRYPATVGKRPGPLTRLIQRYVNRVALVGTQDPVVFAAFFDVLNLVAPPIALFQPGLLLRVLKVGRLRGLDRPPMRLADDAPAVEAAY